MRTTLDIADDVLQAAKELARRKKKSTGKIISDLARAGLTASLVGPGQAAGKRLGFQPFPKRGGIVTNELIDSLREDDVY